MSNSVPSCSLGTGGSISTGGFWTEESNSRGVQIRWDTGTQYFNVEMVRYASSDDTQGRVTNLGLTEAGKTFNGTGNIYERRRREPLGGSGGMVPKKIFKSEKP